MLKDKKQKVPQTGRQ